MASIEIFKNESFGEVRVAGTSEEPLFCASDLCRALGYANGRDAISKHVDEGDVAKCDTPTASGIQPMTYVNESGLYALIFSSKQPNAKAFKKWVTSEVLPSIRKTGSYSTEKILSPSELILKLAQMNVENERKMKALEEKQTRLESEIEEIKQRTTTDLHQSTIVAYVSRNNIKLDVKLMGQWVEKHQPYAKRGISP